MGKTSKKPVTVLYDGHCSVCHNTVRAIARMDPGQRRLRGVDIRSDAEVAERAGIDRASLESQMHLIHPDGRVTAGPDAVRDALRALRLGGIAWMLSLPIVGGLFARFYDWFARNRLRWFARDLPDAGDCADGSCSVHHASNDDR